MEIFMNRQLKTIFASLVLLAQIQAQAAPTSGRTAETKPGAATTANVVRSSQTRGTETRKASESPILKGMIRNLDLLDAVEKISPEAIAGLNAMAAKAASLKEGKEKDAMKQDIHNIVIFLENLGENNIRGGDASKKAQ